MEAAAEEQASAEAPAGELLAGARAQVDASAGVALTPASPVFPAAQDSWAQAFQERSAS